MGKKASHSTSGYLWVEEGTPSRGIVARVAPLLRMHQTYSYAVPPELSEIVSVGHRVLVPMGRSGRLVQAFVLTLDERVWDSTLRPIDSLVDDTSFLTHELITLGEEIAAHYACPLGTTLKAMTPESVRQARGLKTVRYLSLAMTAAQIAESGKRISQPRQAIIDVLAEADEPRPRQEVLARAGASTAVLAGMIKAGWVHVDERKEVVDSGSDGDEEVKEPSFDLTAEQQSAISAIGQRIDEAVFSVTLLFGVSGCGKTEVYIRAMRRVLAMGRQAILLVPEIVLTTQLVRRLASRFDSVAVSHSGLTDAQRSVIWRQVASGAKQVVIGTRSAVFAPCPDLGLICVDEEQETSYKNLQAPRFHVRDVAIMRAHQLGIPIVLGSATPALETWYNSDHKPSYHRVEIRSRVKDLPLPKVHLVDMCEEVNKAGAQPILSHMMVQLLTQTLDRGEQAIILMNRRGYAPRVFCPSCKTRLVCPNCDVGMVVHVATGESVCHYCLRRMKTPRTCPHLGCGQQLVQLGLGTQRIEDVLRSRFPGAVIKRIDSDTVTHRQHYQDVVNDLQSRRIDIAVGTQMIAKGLDFPGVSLVGMLDADPAGLSSDFRAQERLFQLVTQVAGRAGRAEATGRVVVQTTVPDVGALQHALSHDYPSFAADEQDMRRRAGFPPYRRLARVVLAHARDEFAQKEAMLLADRVSAAIEALGLTGADVLGPSPCVLARLRGRYRYDLLIRTVGPADLRRLLGEMEQQGQLRTKATSTIVDVDPVSLG